MRHLVFILLITTVNVNVFSSDLPSTYFSFYIASNNALEVSNTTFLVTAIYDSTFIDIIDDESDGDNDDSYSGYLMAGESYELNIEENAINDNAPYMCDGKLKSDGDFFIITTNRLVYVSKTNDNQWQLNYSPSIDRSTSGKRFIYHADRLPQSNQDLSLIVFEDQTEITMKDITINQDVYRRYSNVQRIEDSNAIEQTIDAGIHIIRRSALEQNTLKSGHTYLIESNKAIDVQGDPHFSKWHEERSKMFVSLESLPKELYYLTAPNQIQVDRKVRIISWNDTNKISVEQFSNGSWKSVESWELEKLSSKEWSYTILESKPSPVFRVRCSKGKTISVFTESTMDIAKTNTSDQGAMATSKQEW